MKTETVKRKCEQKGFTVEILPDGRLLLDGSIYIRNLHLPINIIPCKKSHLTIVNGTTLMELEDSLEILRESKQFS